MDGRFAISAAPIDVAALHAALSNAHAGACATFEGWVRDHHAGRAVHSLRYEAFEALAAVEGARVMELAVSRFDIIEARCVHRVGELGIGELAVWVGVSAAHRDAAFDACRFIIDAIKRDVPIWKHERYADGQAEWLHPAP